MKILIVGCGISGLAIYRALRKHLGDNAGISIKVVDSHDLPPPPVDHPCWYMNSFALPSCNFPTDVACEFAFFFLIDDGGGINVPRVTGGE
jgi:hypothetical protein